MLNVEKKRLSSVLNKFLKEKSGYDNTSGEWTISSSKSHKFYDEIEKDSLEYAKSLVEEVERTCKQTNPVVHAIRELGDTFGAEMKIKPWPATLKKYMGLWTKPGSPWVYKLTIDGSRFLVGDDDNVKFILEWEVLKCGPKFDANKIGTKESCAEEVMSGKLIRGAKTVVALGIEKREPPSTTGVIGCDMYALHVSDDNMSMEGLTRGRQGTWGNPIYLRGMEKWEELDAEGLEEIYKVVSPDSCYVSGTRRVGMNFRVKNISNIDSKEQTFRISFTVTLSWDMTIKDLNKFTSTRTLPKPEWSPPKLDIVNAVEIYGQEEDIPTVRRIDGKLMVCKEIEYIVLASETLELEHFPFDYQELKVVIGFNNARGSDVIEMFAQQKSGLVISTDKKHGSASGWNFDRDPTYEFASSKGEMLGSQLETITVEIPHIVLIIKATREATSFMLRIYLIMALLSLSTLLLFSMESEDVSSRLSYGVTMLLTAVAYALVISGELPSLGYLTFLEKYILCMFVFILLVMFIACAELTYIRLRHLDEKAANVVNTVILSACAGFWVAMQAVFLLYIKFFALPAEEKKFKGAVKTPETFEDKGKIEQVLENQENPALIKEPRALWNWPRIMKKKSEDAIDRPLNPKVDKKKSLSQLA